MRINKIVKHLVVFIVCLLIGFAIRLNFSWQAITIGTVFFTSIELMLGVLRFCSKKSASGYDKKDDDDDIYSMYHEEEDGE